MVPEAELKDTGAGLVPASVGWFVMNEETQDAEAAYAHVPPAQPARYRAGVLPEYVRTAGSA